MEKHESRQHTTHLQGTEKHSYSTMEVWQVLKSCASQGEEEMKMMKNLVWRNNKKGGKNAEVEKRKRGQFV